MIIKMPRLPKLQIEGFISDKLIKWIIWTIIFIIIGTVSLYCTGIPLKESFGYSLGGISLLSVFFYFAP